MTLNHSKRIGLAAVLLCLALPAARADTLTWVGQTGDWAAVENWTNWSEPWNTHVPAGGDDAVITATGALVLVASSPAFLGSLVLSNATLTMSNWDTLLSATNLSVLNKGVLTCGGPFTNDAVSNRVNLLCSNLLIEAGGAINVLGKGFSGGINITNTYNNGHGPGGGLILDERGGGGHGGAGAHRRKFWWRTNSVYGSATAPLEPGSGGGAGSSMNIVYGGHGGGAVRIVADRVTVNGSINANARYPYSPNGVFAGNGDGGSGGSIFITCAAITGTNGLLSADGSDCYNSTAFPGGGGGGRIAVLYDTNAQHALPVPALRFSADAGLSSTTFGYTNTADLGTLYFPDSYFFSPTNLFTGKWLAPGLDTIEADTLIASNVWACLPTSTLKLTNALVVAGTNAARHRLQLTNDAVQIEAASVTLNAATLALGRNEWYQGVDLYRGGAIGPTLACAGDFILTNSSSFAIWGGLTNPGAPESIGARILVDGNLTVYSNCWVCPAAHPTNGAVPLFTVSNLAVDVHGGFNANNLGFAGARRVLGSDGLLPAYGPGVSTSTWNRGSGHGGLGAGELGPTYGDPNAPLLPGSGARCSGNGNSSADAPCGGGSVQIRAEDKVAVYGRIQANVAKILQDEAYYRGPGSSGGSIYIICDTFIGDSNTVLSADAEQSQANYRSYYGGGGGRIAVWRANDLSGGLVSNSVLGGVGDYATGYPGTVVWGQVPVPGTVIRFR